MKENKTIILGAGISGISTAYHLGLKGIDATIYEKDSEWGGLCGNFSIDGFRFDKAVHLSYAKSKYVQEFFQPSSPIINKGVEMDFFNEEDIVVRDARILPYGNVVFYKGMEADRRIVQDYLESVNIDCVGALESGHTYGQTNLCLVVKKLHKKSYR